MIGETEFTDRNPVKLARYAARNENLVLVVGESQNGQRRHLARPARAERGFGFPASERVRGPGGAASPRLK